MEFQEVVTTRRSVRKYTDKEIAEEDLREIVRLASYAPSWKNTQCVSYVFVRDEEKKARLSECVCGFAYNTKTIGRCKVLCAVVTEKGKSGCEEDGSFGTPRKDEWEMFDAGIAAQTFCLAARERGIGTVIMGYVDDGEAGKVLHLPEKKRVTAFIAMGYPEAEGKMPPRKSVDELMTAV